jgi:hypothetical protein
MKKNVILFLLLLFKNIVFAQYIEIDRTNINNGLTIKKSGIGLNITDGVRSFGTAINAGKAIIQTNTDDVLAFRTNNLDANRIVVYNNTFRIGPSVFSPEIFAINYGRLKFTGSKDAVNASGIEFTNTTGTLLRGFVGMADDGGHLGLWGYGNGAFNVRMSANNGFLGIGAINPATRLHINGNIKTLGLGNPLTEQLLMGSNTGNLIGQPISNIYQVTPADFSHKTGTTNLIDDIGEVLYFSSTTIGSPILTAPFNAPNGVTLKSMNVSFVDNNSSFKLEGCLVKININGSVSTDVLCLNTGSSPTSASVASLTTFAPSNFVLDYTNFHYVFRARILNNSNVVSPWPSNTIFFYRANFTYDYLNY